ncbi:hypothetical protein RYX36_031086 [Vicia faba]
MPPKKNASQQKPRRSKYIIEEVPDSDLFIPMPQSIQVANHPPHSTQPPMHPTPPLMHSTPPSMHTTPPMSGSFTGLLSTPPGCTPFLLISLIAFISPTGYMPYFPTGPDTYFPMPSMQSSGPIHMELGGSSMPRPMPSEDDHGDTSALGDSSAPGDTSSAPGETSAQEDTSAPEEQTRRKHILRRNALQKLREEMRRQTQEYQEAMWIANERVQRFDQFFASRSSGGRFGGTSGHGGIVEEEEEGEEQDEQE